MENKEVYFDITKNGEILNFENPKNARNIVMPNTIKVIPPMAFKGNNVYNIKFLDGLTKISESAFDSSFLENIDLPNSVKDIEEGAFSNCLNLKQFNCPENLTKLNNYLFYNCKKLKNFTSSKNINSIESYVFAECENLENVVLNEGLKRTGFGVFTACVNLKNVLLPQSLEAIEEELFADCYKLSNVSLPENLRVLGDKVFRGCKSLQQIEIPKEIKQLNKGLFLDCSSLKLVNLPKNLMAISNDVFKNCKSLRKIDIPENVKTIGSNAFENCSNLQSLNIPYDITTIENESFRGCSALKTIKFSYMLKTIKEGAFADCSSLQNVEFPNGLNKIEKYAFCNCANLQSIKIPNTVTEIDKNAFNGCKNLKEVEIPKSLKTLHTNAFPYSNFKYIQKTENGFKLTNFKPQDNFIELNANNRKYASMFILNWNKKETLFQELENKNTNLIYSALFDNVSSEDFQKLVETKDLRFFNKLNFNKADDYAMQDFIRFYYSLGGFQSSKETNNAQRVGEFFANKFDKAIINVYDIKELFANGKTKMVEVTPFSKEKTDFYIGRSSEVSKKEKDNFERMLDYARNNNKDFVSFMYNGFDVMQLSNTNNKNKQKILLPTLDHFIKCYKGSDFSFVLNNMGFEDNEKNKKILKTLSTYFPESETIKEGLKILKEKEDLKVSNNITKYPISEKNMFSSLTNTFGAEDDILERIDEQRRLIEGFQDETLRKIVEYSNNNFTFEMLSKDSELNFVLGKVCNCCAQLQGCGYGICRASVISPDVQTMVIKDDNSNIVAKATIYVNRKECYGVFNSVEVKNGLTEADIEKIYKKFKLGAQVFAEEYNLENPNAQLKQINVGMHLNDLEPCLIKYDVKADKLFKAVSYADYGVPGKNYAGDSSAEQYVVWKDKKDLGR